MCAPSRIWSRAISTQSSQRPSSMASRNFFEPLALVRSRVARGRSHVPYALDDLTQVLRSRTAAAADQGKAVFAYEGLLGVSQFGRRQRVVRAIPAEDRQARVRHA